MSAYSLGMTLPRAIDDLYTAFAKESRPPLVADPYGLQSGEAKVLLTEPVRELSLGLLGSFLSGPDEYHPNGLKFALPRLLELVAGGAEFWMLPLRSVSLTPPQQAALHAFALAWLGEMFAQRRCPLDNLAMLEWLGLTRAELLQAWREYPNGAEILAGHVLLTGEFPAEWSRDEVVAWLEEAFFKQEEAESQQRSSDALLILSAMDS